MSIPIAAGALPSPIDPPDYGPNPPVPGLYRVEVNNGCVSHWKACEAMSEFYQNWHDAIKETSKLHERPFRQVPRHCSCSGVYGFEARHPDTHVLLGFVRYIVEDGSLEFTNLGAHLSADALTMGSTSKLTKTYMGGKNGVGMKLGTFVMMREGYCVRYEASGMKWNFWLRDGLTHDLICRVSAPDMNASETHKALTCPNRHTSSSPETTADIRRDVSIILGGRLPTNEPGKRLEHKDFLEWLKISPTPQCVVAPPPPPPPPPQNSVRLPGIASFDVFDPMSIQRRLQLSPPPTPPISQHDGSSPTEDVHSDTSITPMTEDERDSIDVESSRRSVDVPESLLIRANHESESKSVPNSNLQPTGATLLHSQNETISSKELNDKARELQNVVSSLNSRTIELCGARLIGKLLQNQLQVARNNNADIQAEAVTQVEQLTQAADRKVEAISKQLEDAIYELQNKKKEFSYQSDILDEAREKEATMEFRIGKLTAKVRGLREDNTTLRTQVDHQNQELQNSFLEAAEARQCTNTFQAEKFNKLQQENDSLTASLLAKNSELADSALEVKTLSEIIRALRSEQLEKDSRLENAESATKAAQQLSDTLKTSLITRDSMLHVSTVETNRLRQTVNALEARLSTKDSQIRELTLEVDNLQQTIEMVPADLPDVYSQLRTWIAEYEDIQPVMNHFRVELAAKESQLIASKDAAESLQRAILNLEAKAAAETLVRNSQLKDSMVESERLREAHEVQRRDWIKGESELSAELEKRAAEAEDLKQVIATNQDEHGQIVTALKDALDAKEDERKSQWKSAITGFKSQQRTIQERDAEIKELVKQIRNHKSRAATIKDERQAQWKADRAALKQKDLDIQDRDTKIEDRDTKIEDLKGQIHELISTVTAEEKRKEKRKAQRKAAKKILKANELTIKSQNATIEELQQQILQRDSEAAVKDSGDKKRKRSFEDAIGSESGQTSKRKRIRTRRKKRSQVTEPLSRPQEMHSVVRKSM